MQHNFIIDFKKKVLHYKIFNNTNTNAPWITFIHGAGGSSNIWFKQLKAFRENYNLLLIDLRGHGLSKNIYSDWKKYSFEAVGNDVLEVLDFLKIQQTHFVGISLGTIIIRELTERHPERTLSMILGGAVTHFNFRCRILMRIANTTKSFVPYMILYNFFAFIIMPKKNHSESRNLFVSEAKKLYQKEFKKWISMITQLKPIFNLFHSKEADKPTLYIMGSEDYLFLPSVKKIVASHKKTSLAIIEHCGHVVNIEQPQIFNALLLDHLHLFEKR